MGVSGRFAAAYYGCTQLPQGFGQVDLASTVAELRREEPIRTSIEITSGKLIIYREDGLEIFKHSVHYITSINTVSREKSLLAYITKSVTALGVKEYTQYVFRLECSEKVSELFTAVRDEKKSTVPQILNKSLHNVSGSTSLCGDSPPNLSTFYEVLFLGKIKVSHRRAPPTFIDEAVKKISNKTRKQDSQDTNLEQENIPESAAHPLSKNLPARPSLCDVIQAVTPKPEEKPEEQPSKIMLMQIGRNDIRLISPDTKQVLVHKTFREISHCSCGQEYNLNFGFICKEERGESAGYVGYIFQCDSTNVVEDIMQGLKSAFYTAHETARKERMEQQCPSCPMIWFNQLCNILLYRKERMEQQCPSCPMIWFNQLCNELEGLPANKAQSALLRKVESLGEVGSGILAKMEGAETTDIDEQNQILMMLLKANCEVKQGVHEHIPGSIFSISRERTPPPQPQESVLAEAAKKAKRSLADSFNIIRRRASVDVSGESSAVPNISVERPTPVKATPSKAAHPFSVTLAERMLRDKSMSPDLSHLPPRSPLQPLTPDKHVAFQCELPNSGICLV
ncbi:TBC1 domain family member 1 isoform X3 [Eurytemora carolleeae]|uniref:TBC1 domain family member 1 isoform X3 n=1 Tax=Eurytemora carolleeae TaxID=1294199 RepID=UPI000C785B76|nr:TBC1 domain family member 1 isoform X3 [Eurytemora carolleeae]|eukprot:XP_023322552.1 TBC1 domain family member 1-like isoform X3 [Eurytemora affinis]